MDIFSALADPTRRNIIEILAASGELSATDISHNFHISPPAISQHLKVLRESNLVTVEKRSQQRIYHINPKTISELEGWIKKMTKNWDHRFSKLDKLLLRQSAEKKKLDRPKL